MKLVFYDEMPKSPGGRPGSANRLSHWVLQGKDFASKASDRASVTIKKKLSKQNISAPLPITTTNYIPSQWHHFRPLELSIYIPGNRLSDLPQFEHVDFTDLGEIQVPPKALIRTRSENVSHSFSKPTSRPTISMIGERQLDYWQQPQRSSSLVSQRPPSAFEGLNSHPTCWTSLPGPPPPQGEAVIPLSPTAEEEEPSPVLPKTAKSMVLEFPPPPEEEQPGAAPITTLPPLSIQVPYKKPLMPNPARLNSFNHTRISQWLSHSSSLNAPPRSQFYQCAISPPLQHQHPSAQTSSRSRSFSASSTLTSSIASPTETESLASMTSMTTAPTTTTIHPPTPRSRSGTLRSMRSSRGKCITVAEDEASTTIPDIPAIYAQAHELSMGKTSVTASILRQGVAF